MSNLEEIFDNCEGVTTISYDLRHMGKAFCTVGNPDVGERLINMSVRLEVHARSIRGTYSQEINERAGMATENTRNLLEAITTGIEIGKGN